VTVGGSAEASFLRSILEEVPTGIWVGRAPGGEAAYANAALAAILGAPNWIEPAGDGYRFEDAEGRPFSSGCLPFTQVVRRLAPAVVEDLVIARADGRRVPVRALAKPLFDEAGELRHVVIAVRDVTAERETAAEAIVARHKLRAALDHAPIILFAYDVDGTITVSEGAGLASLGVKSGQLLGQNVHELYKDIPGVMDNHARALAGESFRTISEIGDAVLETWISPLRGPGGEIGGVLGVSTDITERRRMERQVDRAERLAALGRLAASVAHEINNPLSYSIEALRLMGDLIPTSAPTVTGRLAELIAEAADGMERVRLITRDLKAFARWDEDVRSPQDLGQAISAATKMVATRTGARARVELRLGPPTIVSADPTRLVQIFVNLLLNSTDALPAHSADRNLIAVSTRSEGGTVAVEVADNGPGVPVGVRDRIFDPFFTTKAVGEGTGLGLFVTRNLVESLGGAIELDDAPGGGARFTIRLPLLSAPARPVPLEHAPAAEAPARGRVVIIDDEPQLAKIFGARLAKEFDVQIFTSGRAALEHLLAGDGYDLVFCDLMMPDVSGMQVFETLRAARPGLERRIVFMTGGVFDPAVAEFLSSVPNDCVDKPFDVRAEAHRRLGAR
jgi:PAS domain S-box-containing protein